MVHGNFYHRALGITRKMFIAFCGRFYGRRREQSQFCLRGRVHIVHNLMMTSLTVTAMVGCCSAGIVDHAEDVLSLVLSMLSNFELFHSPRVLHPAQPGMVPSIN